MANDSLNIPIKDFLQKLKIYAFGFFTPVGILFFSYFGSPFFLTSGTEWKKSDILILEIRSLITEKQIQISSEILKKKRANGLLLVFDENFLNQKFIGLSPNYFEEIKSTFLKFGVPLEKIQIIKIDTSKDHTTNFIAKEVAKHLLTARTKSIIVQSGEFQSTRIYTSYKTTLSPLGIEVSIYPEKGKFTSTNWFSSEDGIELVTKELVKYIYNLIRGNK